MDNETETKIIERLDRLVDGIEKLDRIAVGVDKLVDAIPKPASRIRQIIEITMTIVSVAGILSVIDVIINWLGGKQ